jgi:formylglycine-generating enzyme required for sulfatase activity
MKIVLKPVEEKEEIWWGRGTRGGAWHLEAKLARLPYRNRGGTSYRLDFLSFRLARSIK